MHQLKHDEITRQIIGCAMKVHSTLGNGFQEKIYQQALELEMASAGLVFERELDMPIYYMNQQIGERRVDFLLKT